ncbi:thiamine-phosphate kinase [Halohasta litorea]|uniref:Thiamine-monophosphate kinase n=1 Tax=Halohasta litorea TaxID=869891 RepID=A0ABD6D3R4_9EURY|nr:thiamine-phosphate kinase [Halohasta litorea]
MDEREALRLLGSDLSHAGDDAAVVGSTAITTDMLHESTDFPAGTTRYTAGWRSVAASLSDLAAMGADPTAAVAAYADEAFIEAELRAFVDGARAVCATVGAEYVGGDLDHHSEFTVATTAIGNADRPVFRSGASADELVCVTGTVGRSAAALALFDRGETDRANELFQFTPRIAAGRQLAGPATAMMDSSDGLARSLHQLAEASDCGFAVDGDSVPVDEAVESLDIDRWEAGVHFGEDFELVCTLPEAALSTVETDVPITVIGRVTDAEAGVTVDGEPLPDRGYTH